MVRVRAAASRSGLACGRLLFDGWVGKAERPVALRLHDDEPSPCFQGKSKNCNVPLETGILTRPRCARRAAAMRSDSSPTHLAPIRRSRMA